MQMTKMTRKSIRRPAMLHCQNPLPVMHHQLKRFSYARVVSVVFAIGLLQTGAWVAFGKRKGNGSKRIFLLCVKEMHMAQG
mmetsp:Transcript_44667/g.72711  ORF Transcript_44667/g.72711 Transcript_44667/m.72711 type:complete len:81 (+) Transcript_44667:763-1005(+)